MKEKGGQWKREREGLWEVGELEDREVTAVPGASISQEDTFHCIYVQSAALTLNRKR